MSLVFLMGIILVFPSVSGTVNAEREAELTRERNDIQSELEEKRTELEEIQTDLVELEEELDIVNDVIESNEKEIAKTEESIEQSEEEVQQLQKEIEQLEIDIKRRNEILKERASALQKSGGSLSYIDVLFGAQSFTDLIDRVSIVARITQSDSSLLQNLQADQDQVAGQKEIVDTKLTELENAKIELEHIQELTLEQKESYQEKQEELEEKQEKSEDLIQALQIEDNELKAMIEEAKRIASQQTIVQYSSETPSVTPSLQTSSHVSGNLNTIISSGYRYIGNSRYKAAGGRSSYDIKHGLFDCSGFVSWAFRQGGVNVPSSTDGLSRMGTRISTSNMQPGDLVFFNTYKTNGHVGIYLGNNQFLGSQSSTGVAIASMNNSYWASRFTGHVRRIVN